MDKPSSCESYLIVMPVCHVYMNSKKTSLFFCFICDDAAPCLHCHILLNTFPNIALCFCNSSKSIFQIRGSNVKFASLQGFILKRKRRKKKKKVDLSYSIILVK